MFLAPLDVIREALGFDQVRSLLAYDPVTGEFRWRVSRRGCSAGALAGVVRPSGYRQIMLGRRHYYAHRLAWLYMTGDWPSRQIDHRDGDRSNNAWSNLREADLQQQAWNHGVMRNNQTGLKGVRRARGRYVAMIREHGRDVYLGSFDDPLKAHEAYAERAKALHGEFFRQA